MNDSRTDSLSAHALTHDRKGREGKGIGRDALLHASSAYWFAPQPVDNPFAAATADDRTSEHAKSEIGRWAK